MLEAQKLRCGDVFIYNNREYLVLSNFTDLRHTQSIITTMVTTHDMDNVYVFRFIRIFKVRVTRHIDLKIHSTSNTESELKSIPRKELDDLGQRMAIDRLRLGEG